MQKLPIQLNGRLAMVAIDCGSDTLTLELEWPDTPGESWSGSYRAQFIAALSRRELQSFAQMLRAALAEQGRSEDLLLDVEAGADDRLDLVLTYLTRFDRAIYRLPLKRRRLAVANADAAVVSSPPGVEQLRDAERRIETENARLRRENARLRSEAAAAAGLRPEVAALREAARGIEAELAAGVAATPAARKSPRGPGDVDLTKLQAEARELRAMERILQLRLRQVSQELALHKRARVHGSRFGSASAGASPSPSPRPPRPPQSQSSAAAFFPATGYAEWERQRSRRSQRRASPAAAVPRRASPSPSASRGSPRRPTSSGGSSPRDAADLRRRPVVLSKSKTPAPRRQPAVLLKPAGGLEEDVLQIDERLDRLQSFLNKALLVHP